jgi:hypothetical protein
VTNASHTLLCALFADNFSFLFSAAQKQANFFTTTTLPIDEANAENDEWFAHPDEDLEVNKAGTHCRSVSTQAYKNIKVKTYLRDGWKDFMVSSSKSFSRLAIECFWGRKLQRRETVEHKNGVRDDNSKSNLLPRFKLFQIASRRPFNVSLETNTPRVYRHGKREAYGAAIYISTPDGKTVSIRKNKHFWWSHYDSQDAALAAAIAWQQKHRLEEGMIYV